MTELYDSSEVEEVKQKNQSLEISLLSFQNAYHRTLQNHSKAIQFIESLKSWLKRKKKWMNYSKGEKCLKIC